MDCDYCGARATTATAPPTGPLLPNDQAETIGAMATVRPIWACLAHADRARQDRDACKDPDAWELVLERLALARDPTPRWKTGDRVRRSELYIAETEVLGFGSPRELADEEGVVVEAPYTPRPTLDDVWVRWDCSSPGVAPDRYSHRHLTAAATPPKGA